MIISSSALQKWGNSLAMRIPADVVQRLHLHSGTVVNIQISKGAIVVKPTSGSKMSLDERLALFDPEKHGGEVMATSLIGKENF